MDTYYFNVGKNQISNLNHPLSIHLFTNWDDEQAYGDSQCEAQEEKQASTEWESEEKNQETQNGADVHKNSHHSWE